VCLSHFLRALSCQTIKIVAERDANKEALRQVEKATGTDPEDGKDLLESDALRRQLDEAKQSLSAPGKPSSKTPV
jgi:hypothetical protein